MNLHELSPTVAAGIFGLHYILAAFLCGLCVRIALRVPSTSQIDGEAPAADGDADFQRHEIAYLLLGSAFAPLAIGWLQSVWLIAAPGLPRFGYVLLHWAALIVIAVLLRRHLVYSLRSCLSFCFCRLRRVIGTCVLLATMAVVVVWAITSSMLPWPHYDSTSYSLDARRLADERDYSALMSETPDEKNHLTLGHHGKSYQFFLSVSLLYPTETKEHLPLRIASRIVYAHVVLCLAALGLQFSTATGLLTAFLIVAFYPPLYWLVNAASRDSFRLLAIVAAIGIVGAEGSLKTNAGRICSFLAIAYVWHAHSSSILVAPTLAVCLLLPMAKSRKTAGMFIACFMLAAFAGGFGALESTLRQGRPGFVGNPNWWGTPLMTKYWDSRWGAAGEPNLFAKMLHHWQTDGMLLVTLIFISIGVLLVRRIWRGKPNSQTLFVALLFVLISELQFAGVFDLAQKQISTAFFLNYRYRSHAVLVGAVLAAATICCLIKEFRLRKAIDLLNHPLRQVVLATGAVGLLAWTAGSKLDNWLQPEHVYCTRWDEFQLELRNRKSRWGGYLTVFDGVSPQESILTEDDYYVWFYCDHKNVLSVLDPRTRRIWRAQSGNEALRGLDELNIRYIHLYKATLNLLKETDAGFYTALQAEFTPLEIEDGASYVIFKRQTATPSSVRPIIVNGAESSSIQRVGRLQSGNQ